MTDVAKAAQGADKVAYDDKVFAAMAFTQELDTAYEQSGYSNYAAVAVGKAYIASVKDNYTFADAVTPANLRLTVYNAVEAGYAAGASSSTASMQGLAASGSDMQLLVDGKGSHLEKDLHGDLQGHDGFFDAPLNGYAAHQESVTAALGFDVGIDAAHVAVTLTGVTDASLAIV